MATMKMTGCMKIVSRMSEADQDALLSRLDAYQADGVPAERAQLMAAQDMLAEIQGERDQLFNLLREQHPDLFSVAESPAPQVQASRQRAYHGTPHRGIDKFSTDKIGTGEGAQAYGWGLYFTDRKEIAEHYREKLSSEQYLINGEPPADGTQEFAAQMIDTWRGRRTRIEIELNADRNIRKDKREAILAEVDRLLESKAEVRKAKGQLYEVDIPQDSEMLLWDKPLSEQPKAVRSAVEGLAGATSIDAVLAGKDIPALLKWVDSFDRNNAFDEMVEENPDMTADDVREAIKASYDSEDMASYLGSAAFDASRKGESIYREIATKEGSDKAASEALMAAGIRGIKYLDGTSRDAGDGSYNYVVFSGDDVAIQQTFYSRRRTIFGDPAPLANWTMPAETKFDNWIRLVQDKQVDMKRVIEAISRNGGLSDQWNAYLQEELYHGRSAKATKDFGLKEVRPLMEELEKSKVSLADFEEYLHNRHAEERNTQIAKVNPAMPDGGSGIDTADARAYLAALDPAKRRTYEALARRVDAISQGTRELLVRSGLETQDTINQWEGAYKNYVPLMREDLDYGLSSGMGTGSGFSVRGPASRRATGSDRPVVDILANLLMQREQAIVRAEKTRVGTALYGLALQNPNADFWLPVDPKAIKDVPGTMAKLQAMGLDPMDVRNIMEEPLQQVVDPRTGLVTYRVNANLRNADNVMAVRVNGEDKFLFFNTRNERAARMAASLKNLDATSLEGLLNVSGKISRYFAAINTQYNPVFGAINLLRDVQGAAVNLSSTPLAGEQAAVLKGVGGATLGIYRSLRADRSGQSGPPGSWSALWEEFQREGGQTGFRDMFRTSEDRTQALQAMLDPASWTETKWGKILTAGGTLKVPLEAARKGAAEPVFNWLSDYNETLENAVRLSAYKAAKAKGMTAQQAASLAKNLTVNFNRKGEIGTQMGALYAFFNASVQGTARLAETLKGPAGKKILAGGLLLGTVQALALAAADFDEDEPPDFIKERNFVIPTGDGKYATFPMPLGLNVIPNTSRVLTEWALAGGKDPGKRFGQIVGAFADMFNPIGNAGLSVQTIAPTFADPLVALAENRDWSGKPIAKEDRSGTDPTPGYTRAKETASWVSKQLAYYLNLASGGTKYKPGGLSPTPDQLDYLIGQVTGGVGREVLKVSQAVESSVTGEELPTYKVPIAGRFYGDTKEQAATADRFYRNVTTINEHENEIEGRRKNREGGIPEYIKENPEARLVTLANRIERDVAELRRKKREMLEKDRPKESIKMIELQITRKMEQLNARVEALQD